MSTPKRPVIIAAAAISILALATPRAQQAAAPALDQELRRIFVTNDYAPERFGPAVWLDEGATYGLLERSASDGTRVLVAVDTATGRRDVLADRALLTPAGAQAPLEVAAYAWSKDRRKALIFTNTRRVWRQHTRGDYWLLDRTARTLRKIGGSAPEASLMFAKLSPDAAQAAYVRDANLYVENLASGDVRQLTTDGAETIVNGTADW